MATMKELRQERLNKLEQIKELGLNPYPAETNRTHMIAEIVNNFDAMEGKNVQIAGRITGIRKFGKLAFIVLRDFSGTIQLFIQANNIAETSKEGNLIGIKDLNLLDSGDFVQANGEVIRSKTGEISVATKELKLLTKSLRPMPTVQDGFSNKEERFRRRYVDMNVNIDVRDRFVRRSKFWQATRDFLNSHGFYEVNLPVLEHTTGGADAHPCGTRREA